MYQAASMHDGEEGQNPTLSSFHRKVTRRIVTPEKSNLLELGTPEDYYPWRIFTPKGISPQRENPGGLLPGGFSRQTGVGASDNMTHPAPEKCCTARV